MLLETRLLQYNSIKINGIEIDVETGCTASYNAPFNKIDVEMTPINGSLSYYEVRVTPVDDSYDIGVGALPKQNPGGKDADDCSWISLPGNKSHKFSIMIEPESFVLEAGQTSRTFRISFYAKSAIDGSWDVYYLLFTLDGSQLMLENGDALYVLTTREAPQN